MSNLPSYYTPQSNWSLTRDGDKLRLAGPIGEHDYVVERVGDTGKVELKQVDKHEALTGKPTTLQVHRSDAGHLYGTVHDGKVNPTFRLNRKDGDQWEMTFKRQHTNPHKHLFHDLPIHTDQVILGMQHELGPTPGTETPGAGTGTTA